MFERLLEIARKPAVKNTAIAIGVIEASVATNALVFYKGKIGKTAKAVGTLGFTLFRDAINEAKISEDALRAQVDVAVNLKHDEIREELKKALASANESAAKLSEMVSKMSPPTPEHAPEQLHVDVKS